MSKNMNEIELDALLIRLQASNTKIIKENLLHRKYNSTETQHVEAYLRIRIEEEKNAPTFMYHRRTAPKGRKFKAYEVPLLEKKGWVDSPSKFKKSIKDKLIDVKNMFVVFWCKEWKWILGFIVTLITLYIAYLKLTVSN